MVTKELDIEAERQLTQGVPVRLLTTTTQTWRVVVQPGLLKGHRGARRGLHYITVCHLVLNRKFKVGL